MTWLVYGAYGYTGRLVAEVALSRGERPVLAGRDPGRLEPLARRLGLEHRAFDLENPEALRAAISGFSAVAHCAGPFSKTSAPMVDACIATGVNYLDITGEIDVFEAVLARDAEAKEAGVALLPGSGFDVVPSDCLAASLAAALPGAERLELAFRMDGGVSPGTAKTAMESIGASSRARIGGVITDVPEDRRRRQVTFADGEAPVTALSWGDVSTAYHSTGIGDIVVYAALPPLAGVLSAAAELVGDRAASSSVQGVLGRLAGRLPGPSPRARAKSKGQLWGQASSPNGESVSASMTTPNGYDLTADAVVRVLRRISGGVAAGAYTPSRAFGADFATELDGVVMHPLTRSGLGGESSGS